MKKTKLVCTVIAVTAIWFSVGTFADGRDERETSTLFGSFHSLSGYGAITTSYLQLGNGVDAWMMGGKGGVILNDRFVIGAGGKGLVEPTDRGVFTDTAYSGEDKYIHMGYGGLILEYYLNPQDLIHFSVGVLGGAGSIMYLPYDIDNEDHHDYDFDDVEQLGGDVFLIAEPEINAFINITRFCRIGGGISYRFVKDLDESEGSDRVSNNLLSGPGAQLTVHFGWF